MLSEAARASGVTLVGGSVPERSNGKLYNSCCVYDDKGQLLAKHRCGVRLEVYMYTSTKFSMYACVHTYVCCYVRVRQRETRGPERKGSLTTSFSRHHCFQPGTHDVGEVTTCVCVSVLACAPAAVPLPLSLPGCCRKVHLFDIDIPGKMTFKESLTLTPGESGTVVDTPAGRLGIGICYDIRFPELAMLYAQQGAQALVYPGRCV